MLTVDLPVLFSSLIRYPMLIFLTMTAGACGFYQHSSHQLASEQISIIDNQFGSVLTDIVIIGVTQTSGVRVAFDNTQIVRKLIQQLVSQHSIHSTSPSLTRKILGAGPHDEMMSSYARNGRLASHHVQRLMAAELPAPIALLVRLESDSVEKLPLVAADDSLPPGNSKSRRVRVRLTTRRITSLSVKMLDLRNGREVLARLYTCKKDTTFNKKNAAGVIWVQQDLKGIDNDLPDTTSESLYPLPAPLSRSIHELIQRAVNDIHPATGL